MTAQFARIRRAVIGTTDHLLPWRFEPVALTTMFILAAGFLVPPPSAFSPLARVVFIITVGVLTYFYFRIAQSILSRFEGTGWMFLVLSIGFALYGWLTLSAIAPLLAPASVLLSVSGYTLMIPRAALVVLFLSAVLSRIFNRIDAQRIRAEELQMLAEEQRRELLTSEERVRQQVADILHDRFQSELVTSSLVLQLIAHDVDSIQQSEIEAVIARLDALHSQELRDVLLTLGPNLEHVDLQGALLQLARQFEPAMMCDVSVDDRIDLDREVASMESLLALYRICEQALLNAAKHGQARRCTISVNLGESAITLQVSNDGLPLRSLGSQPGTGMAVINSWVSALEGEWALTPGDEDGAVLTAQIPRSDSPRIRHVIRT